MSTAVPGTAIDEYTLEEALGEGASGMVFAARDGAWQPVALKILRAEIADDPTQRRRFLREARLLADVESSHVAPVLALGETDEYTYMVLPLYEGGSLARKLTEGSMTAAETAWLAAQLAKGLDSLHRHEIVHRDVKPSNVLFDAEGNAVLADFGLARASDSTRFTMEGQLLGTPHYLAPELIEGRDATPATDIYALGCVLYECATGSPPFTATRLVELGFAHLTETPPDPRERRPELSEDFAHSLLAALEKEPFRRPATATALAHMLSLSSTP